MDFTRYKEDLDARLTQFLQVNPPQMQALESLEPKTPKRRSRTQSRSIKSRFIDYAEKLHASGSAGVSIDQLAKTLGVPVSALNRRWLKSKLRLLRRYLGIRGIQTVLVNDRYFAEFKGDSELSSVEDARRFLPLFRRASGLHFIRHHNDWIALAKAHSDIRRYAGCMRRPIQMTKNLANIYERDGDMIQAEGYRSEAAKDEDEVAAHINAIGTAIALRTKEDVYRNLGLEQA